MENIENKDLHKSCIEKIEELYKDNKDMFKKYKESLTKYHFSNEIAIKLKLDLVEIENKYDFIEKQLNKLIDEKKVWTAHDVEMTTFLHKNGFEKPDELLKFIKEYKNHKCICSCPPIEENEKYKEQVMFVDILRFNEKERLRVEKENEGLRYDIDIGMKKRDKENNELKNKILLLEKELENYNKPVLNDNVYLEKDIISNNNDNSKKDINSDDKYKSENVIVNEIVSSDNNDFIKLEKEINKNKDKEITNLVNEVQKYKSPNIIDKDIKVKNKIPYLNKENSFRCPVIKYKDIEKEISKSKIKAAKETMNEIIHYHELYKTLNEEGKKLDEIVKYIIENREIKINSGTNNKTYRNKIKRSYDIYEKYGDKLRKVYFSLTSMSKIYDNKFDEWLEILDNCIFDKIISNNSKSEKNNDSIINFKDVRKKITNIEELENKEIENIQLSNISKGLNNNILYKCKNPNCDDDEIEIKDSYCNYCIKDLKNCRLCNIEFVNDELDVKICEDCNETMEMEGYYEDDDE